VPFELKEIDITKPENKEYHDAYLFDVPVGFIEGKEVFRHCVDEMELETVLRKTMKDRVTQFTNTLPKDEFDRKNSKF
jgi:hypothetical protein